MKRANCVRPFLIRCELTGDRRSPLRFNVFFNLTTPDHRHISDNSLGRSKPLPYIVGYYSSLRAKHLLLFTLHFSLFTFHSSLFTLHFSLFSARHGSPPPYHVVFWETKKWLREFYKINLTIPPPHVRSAPPCTQGRLKMRLSVDLI